jgi:hypothetical protein
MNLVRVPASMPQDQQLQMMMQQQQIMGMSMVMPPGQFVRCNPDHGISLAFASC